MRKSAVVAFASSLLFVFVGLLLPAVALANGVPWAKSVTVTGKSPGMLLVDDGELTFTADLTQSAHTFFEWRLVVDFFIDGVLVGSVDNDGPATAQGGIEVLGRNSAKATLKWKIPDPAKPFHGIAIDGKHTPKVELNWLDEAGGCPYKGDRGGNSVEGVDFSLYFRKYGDYEGGGAGDGVPNWFEFWDFDRAVANLDKFHFLAGQKVAAYYSPYNDLLVMSDGAASSLGSWTLNETGERFEGSVGIDTTAQIAVHELSHQTTNLLRTPQEANEQGNDGDGLDAEYEKNVSKAKPDNPDSYNLSSRGNACSFDLYFYGDDELVAWRAMRGVKGEPGNDWAYPGRQAGGNEGAGPKAANRSSFAVTPGPARTALGSGLTDQAVDVNGDARPDRLRVTVPLTVDQRRNVVVWGRLRSAEGEAIAQASQELWDVTGSQQALLDFEGLAVRETGKAGPYVLDLALLDACGFVFDHRGALTSAYPADAFAPAPASLSGQYADSGVDKDADNLFDALAVDVGMEVARGEAITLQADLFDGADKRISWAEATKDSSVGGDTIRLLFPACDLQRNGADGPFHVRNVALRDATGALASAQSEGHTTSSYFLSDFEPSGEDAPALAGAAISRGTLAVPNLGPARAAGAPAPLSDSAPPQVQWDVLAAYDGPATITMEAIDPSGVARMVYWLDWKGPMIAFSHRVILGVAEAGEHRAQVFAVDMNGNASTPLEATFTVSHTGDVTPPSVGSNAASSYGGPALITVSAADPESGVLSVAYSLDDGQVVSLEQPNLTLAAAGAGPHRLDYWAVDAAGNVSEHQTARFVIAGRGPASFLDVRSTDAYFAAVERMSKRGIIQGYDVTGGREFRPQNNLLRAQFAKMIVGSLELTATESATSPFTDLGPDDTANLYPHEFVAVAFAEGIIRGKTATSFAPYADLTRAHVMTMMVRALQNLRLGSLRKPPPDYQGSLGDFSPDHADNARWAEYNHLLEGLQGFGPGWDPWRPANRGETAQLLSRLIDISSAGT
jgi:hypothetical protein